MRQSPCSAGAPASSPTVFLFHIAPALPSSHQPGNSVFLLHHSSSSLQLHPAEHGECEQGRLAARPARALAPPLMIVQTDRKRIHGPRDKCIFKLRLKIINQEHMPHLIIYIVRHVMRMR